MIPCIVCVALYIVAEEMCKDLVVVCRVYASIADLLSGIANKEVEMIHVDLKARATAHHTGDHPAFDQLKVSLKLVCTYVEWNDLNKGYVGTTSVERVSSTWKMKGVQSSGLC